MNHAPLPSTVPSAVDWLLKDLATLFDLPTPRTGLCWKPLNRLRSKPTSMEETS
jgi:hypothetical protein